MKNTIIIFDLDGTLIDTNTLIQRSFEYVFKKHKPDYTLSEAELLSFLGPPLKATLGKYFEASLIEELVDCYNEHNLTSHKDYVSVYPYVYETLKILKDEGYPLAIFTTKSYRAAMVGIKLFDLEKYFDVIVAGDQIARVKPDPLGIEIIMDKTKAKSAVMVGDSTSDIMSGKNAGVYTIGVDWSPKGSKSLEELHPDLMISRMDEIIEFVRGLKSC